MRVDGFAEQAPSHPKEGCERAAIAFRASLSLSVLSSV